MKQLCNVSWVAQAEMKEDEAALSKWEHDLNRPPPGYIGKRRNLSLVTPELDALMRG